MTTASPRLVFAALHTVKHQKLLKGQVVSKRLRSNATCEYNYPVEARIDYEHGLYACVYIVVTSRNYT